MIPKHLLATVLAGVVSVSNADAQSIVDAAVNPVSDLRRDWLNMGAESPNGRFFVARSYDGDQFQRFDRATRQWSVPDGVKIGQLARWSPDGRFLAYAYAGEGSRVRQIWIMPMDSSTGLPRGSARRISIRPGTHPAWSPDGRRIAFASVDSGRFRLLIVPFNGGDEQMVFDAVGAGGDIDWSPDGRYIVGTHGRPGLPPRGIRVNVANRSVEEIPLPAPRMLGYSRDGERIAHYDDLLAQIVVSVAADGRVLERVRVPRAVVPIGWSRSRPNEFTAVQHLVPSRYQRVSLSDGAIHPLTPVDSVPLGGIRYSPDGRFIAYSRPVGTKNHLFIANSDGSNPRLLGAGNEDGRANEFEWSPSGRHLAYIAGTATGPIHVVDVTSGTDRVLVQPRGTALPGVSLGWRADGDAIRYIWRPNGFQGAAREVREITLEGQDRLIASIPVPASEFPASRQGQPHFISDTLLLLRKPTGVDAVDLRTGSVRSIHKGEMRGRGPFGVSSDGIWIAFSASENGRAVPLLLSLQTGEKRSVPYSLNAGEIADLKFHPDGRNLIASVCPTCEEGLEKWEVVVIPTNGDPVRVLTASQGTFKDFGFPAISPDGRYVAFEAEESYHTRIVTLSLPRSSSPPRSN